MGTTKEKLSIDELARRLYDEYHRIDADSHFSDWHRVARLARKLEARKPPGAWLSRLLTESFVIRESRKISRRWDLDLLLTCGG